MSSYSEYLGRMKQRLPKVQDTRPHRDAGHQTEVVKRLAASGVLETLNPAVSANMMLNAPSTRVNSVIKPSHSVQDTAVYNEYTAGQAVAQSERPINAKTSQIQPVCYSTIAIPEYNDRLRTDAQLALKQAAKNAYARGYSTCCVVCGEPPQFDRGCACALTVAQQVTLPTSVSRPQVPS
jgi:hypothetical protein